MPAKLIVKLGQFEIVYCDALAVWRIGYNRGRHRFKAENIAFFEANELVDTGSLGVILGNFERTCIDIACPDFKRNIFSCLL